MVIGVIELPLSNGQRPGQVVYQHGSNTIERLAKYECHRPNRFFLGQRVCRMVALGYQRGDQLDRVVRRSGRS